ncbi:glutamate 5-kinase [sulfur-oxidizing endosymbiont of Gigantopelta aegis]|uniref:glutamate 5-kinase n=1 Tax=sulfur-oxidizing endosymbiont of Gigantopelta aegis TaxID=2794934 RepID=UPI0018DBA411|nr:glutamate 5-kinase [sulfur-oxidizing endosymbiont of Gigantopelta aegis]
MKQRQHLQKTKRWVVKIGSALLTNEGSGLDYEAIKLWVKQIANLMGAGEQNTDHAVEIVLVSSGAVAEGMKRMGWNERPDSVYKLQAAAAVGQMGLVQAYESQFQKHKLHTAQILLTHDDLSNRTRYLNARSVLLKLITLGIVPVVNENDTVVTDEIRFGDNDTLAALVANLIDADLLVILTDQQGMFDSDPRQNPQAKLLTEVEALAPELDDMAGDSKGALGRGGMATKLRAARLAARSGAATIIASGKENNVLSRVYQGEPIGTLLLANDTPLLARKQWLAGHLQMKGELVLDAGAATVLKNKGSSLLAVGVKSISGHFSRGDMVVCRDESGQEIARGLINYNSDEASRIKGHATSKIASILGYVDEPELIHRDNLIVI